MQKDQQNFIDKWENKLSKKEILIYHLKIINMLLIVLDFM